MFKLKKLNRQINCLTSAASQTHMMIGTMHKHHVSSVTTALSFCCQILRVIAQIHISLTVYTEGTVVRSNGILFARETIAAQLSDSLSRCERDMLVCCHLLVKRSVLKLDKLLFSSSVLSIIIQILTLYSLVQCSHCYQKSGVYCLALFFQLSFLNISLLFLLAWSYILSILPV